MDVVVTTGAISRAKLQSNRHHQPGASTPYKRWSKCTMEKVGGNVFAET